MAMSNDKNNYIWEAIILGSLIAWGLTQVDIKVTVNVTDKLFSNIESAENVSNVELPAR